MARNSGIEWTGSTWNPVKGCIKRKLFLPIFYYFNLSKTTEPLRLCNLYINPLYYFWIQ